MALLPINLETLNSAKGRASSVLAGFTTGQKAISFFALIGLVLAAILFMRFESSPSYQPLFTNLQPSDSGAVVAQLGASKVPYQLSNGGSTILVPAALVDKERVALAEQGMPSSGTVGFSTLEKGGFTTSQFVQQVEYQQALEGQLAQTIESIQGVQSARVSLVVPTQSAFVVANQPATTASVLVNLVPGVTLSSEQVNGIVHLVASATPNLTASNVTLVDNHGNVLSMPGNDLLGTAGSQSKQETAYDNQLAASIENLLNRVVGVGNSAVQVHAILDFNQQSTTLNGIQTNANGQPVTANTSQNTSKQTSSGTGTAPGGVIGSGQPATGGGGNYTTNSTSSQVTNAVGQITQTIQQAPGQVKSTSIAVVLNSSAKSKMSQSQVQSLVTAAAGLNLANGDKLVVSELPFARANTSQAAAAAAAASRKQLIVHVAEGVGLVLLILALAFLALRSSRRAVYHEVPVNELVVRNPSTIDYGDDMDATAEQPVMANFAALEGTSELILSQVAQQIGQHPTEVARLLRSWADERNGEMS